MESLSASKNAAIGEQPKLTSKPMRIHELLGFPKSAGKAVEQHRSEPGRGKSIVEPMGSCDKQTNNSFALKNKPMRIHELLGLPKSAGKATEQHRLEPVRVKYLFDPMGSSDGQTGDSCASARRATLAPGVARNVRRQLLPESADGPGESTPAGELQPTGAVFTRLHGNVNSQTKPVRLGLSKSDGKAKINHRKLLPVRTKFLMESWEKSQTVKPEGQKSTFRGTRTTNVRRKLYTGCPSPAPPKNVVGKSSVASKLQETINTPHKSGKIVKPNAEKSAKTAAAIRKPMRKSCLLPPNSIRDQHLVERGKDRIIEEPLPAIPAESQKIARPAKNAAATRKPEMNVENALEMRDIATFPKAASTPRVPTDAASVVQPCERNREISENGPTQTDHRNLLWLRDNLKHCILTTEEKLLSMKQMLDVVEEMITKNTEEKPSPASTEEENPFQANIDEEKPLEANIEEENPLQANIEEEKSLQANIEKENPLQENIEEKNPLQANIEEENPLQANIEDENPLQANTKNDKSEEILKIEIVDCTKENEKSEARVVASQNEIFDENRDTNRDENFAVDPESDKENVPAIVDEASNDERSESGGKTRRRSARLAAIEAARSPDSWDDSFSRIETELNITHAKSKPVTPLTSASAKRNRLDPRSKRSIREYMMIKSCAKFLQTPDHKGLPTPRAERTGTPAERRAVERALSRQLLSQLTDLYDDSSE